MKKEIESVIMDNTDNLYNDILESLSDELDNVSNESVFIKSSYTFINPKFFIDDNFTIYMKEKNNKGEELLYYEKHKDINTIYIPVSFQSLMEKLRNSGFDFSFEYFPHFNKCGLTVSRLDLMVKKDNLKNFIAKKVIKKAYI